MCNSYVMLTGRKVRILEDLEDVDVLEGQSATFKCKISQSDYDSVQWFLDKTPLHTNDVNEIKSLEGGYHTLTVKKLSVKDSGTITFDAGDQKTSAALTVKEKPPTVTKELAEFTAVIEGADVTLCCETSKSECLVKWFKDGKLLKNTSKHRISRSGNDARLTVCKAEQKDAGTYECQTEASSTKSIVTVTGKEDVCS
uniref:Ig-like domain-containing protein n=1 Tax=Callorhinchus milii TaxID=7868 RepID=A0A4W3HWA3_CALMI